MPDDNVINFSDHQPPQLPLRKFNVITSNGVVTVEAHIATLHEGQLMFVKDDLLSCGFSEGNWSDFQQVKDD